MGESGGFMKYSRREVGHRPVAERIHDFREFDLPLTPEALQEQAARCMNCGIPFCQGAGCVVIDVLIVSRGFLFRIVFHLLNT